MRISKGAALAGIGSAVLLLACAHAPSPAQSAGSTSRARPEVVTGSRLPQRGLDARSCLPATTSAVVVYPREALMNSGYPGNLAAALVRADPASPCGTGDQATPEKK